jgi:hypothetical protein
VVLAVAVLETTTQAVQEHQVKVTTVDLALTQVVTSALAVVVELVLLAVTEVVQLLVLVVTALLGQTEQHTQVAVAVQV